METETIIEEYINDNRNNVEEIIKSRINIFNLILELIHLHLKKNIPSLKGNKSIHELGTSHVRVIIQELDEKVYELSTICEQIPQL